MTLPPRSSAAAHSASAICASIRWTISSACCNALGTFLCRLISIAPIRLPIASSTRRFTPSRSARSPRQPLACTSPQEILDRIRQRGIETAEITLHVGLGTFQPVREEVVEEHKLHREWYEISRHAAEHIQRARDGGRRAWLLWEPRPSARSNSRRDKTRMVASRRRVAKPTSSSTPDSSFALWAPC